MSTAPEEGSGPPARGLSRRTTLRLGSGGALALVLGSAAGWLDRRETSPGPSVAAPSTSTTTTRELVLADIGVIDPGIVALGRRVVEITDEADLATLLARLPAGDGDPLRRASEITETEFRAGDTLVIDGWVLAASEARAAAVITLLCEDQSC